MTLTTTLPPVDLRKCDLRYKNIHVQPFNKSAGSLREIEFVVAHYDMLPFLERLVGQLAQLQAIHLTVADFESASPGLLEDILASSNMPYQVVRLQGNFSRSAGLSAAIEAVRERRKNHSFPGEAAETLIFAIDTSVVASSPNDFVQLIRQFVQCGHTAYAPLFNRLWNPPHITAAIKSAWTGMSSSPMYAGYGLVGMCLGDYDRAGGYDTRWGTRWGMEDIDLVDRLQRRAGLQLVRPFLREIIHSEYKMPSQDKRRRGVNVWSADHLPATPVALDVLPWRNFYYPVLAQHIKNPSITPEVSTALFWIDTIYPRSWFFFSYRDGSTEGETTSILVQTRLFGLLQIAKK